MHTCNNYSSCIGLLNLWEWCEKKRKEKTCVKQFWKELNHVTNLEFGKKCWLAKEELQREDWPHNWKPHLLVLRCREIWLNLKLKVEKKEKIYMKTIENLKKIFCAIQEILKKNSPSSVRSPVCKFRNTWLELSDDWNWKQRKLHWKISSYIVQ